MLYLVPYTTWKKKDKQALTIEAEPSFEGTLDKEVCEAWIFCLFNHSL